MGDFFLNVESEEEYTISRCLFFKRLNEQEHVNLPQVSIQAVKIWITTCLEPLSYLWVNHHILFVSGMNFRTTQFGKALHWSMKSGIDGVHSNMSLATSADVTMTKSEHKGKNTAKKIQIR